MLEGGDLEQWEEEGEEKARSVQLLGFPVSQTRLSQPLCHLTPLIGLQGAALQRANEERRNP